MLELLSLETLQYPILILAGIAGAALNAIAGGGTFFLFPLLIFLGLNPTIANTTNKFGTWIGACAAVGGYWKEVKEERKHIPQFAIIATIGSVIGSLLLLWTPVEQFKAMVPWLMLSATLVFTFGPQITSFTKHMHDKQPRLGVIGKILSLMGQFLIGLYGGFFGAGIGILIIAYSELVAVRTIHQINAIKAAVAASLMTVSTLTFIYADAIAWEKAIPLGIGMMIGGYFGPVLAKKLPVPLIKWFIIIYGFAVSVYFFGQ